jgi:uncharacterized membrane protein
VEEIMKTKIKKHIRRIFRMVNVSEFLPEESREIIKAAVVAAEKCTSAQIKIVVAERSSRMGSKKAVEKKADFEFFSQGLDHTKENTGVMIYISLNEHRVVIRTGKHVQDAIRQEVWEDVVSRIANGIKDKNHVSVICEAIAGIGKALASNFPASASCVNEVPDDVVIREEL